MLNVLIEVFLLSVVQEWQTSPNEYKLITMVHLGIELSGRDKAAVIYNLGGRSDNCNYIHWKAWAATGRRNEHDDERKALQEYDSIQWIPQNLTYICILHYAYSFPPLKMACFSSLFIRNTRLKSALGDYELRAWMTTFMIPVLWYLRYIQSYIWPTISYITSRASV